MIEESSTTGQVTWREPTSGDEAMLVAFIGSGALAPSIDIDP
jgi:hypothetical protein